MTQLHVIQTVATLSESAGGPTRTIGALSSALAHRGIAVDVIAGRGDMLPDAALVTTQLAPPTGIAAALDAALTRVAAAQPILHDNGLWSHASIAATAAARRASVPYVVSVHGMLAPSALAHKPVRKRVAWAVYERRRLAAARVLLATAEAERADICRHVPGVPVATIANGVDLPATLAARPAGTPPTLLFMSRLHPIKNLIGLLDAWVRVGHDFAAWRLRIAGPDEGGHLAVVRAHAARLGAARVDFTGPVADAGKGAAFAAADVFVLPSLSENFGIVVAEALAHGLPVVATRGTPWQGLQDHGCGWWAAADAASLTDALRHALSRDPAERAAMGARGRAWVARDFGWDEIAAQTASVYEWVLHGGARPDCIDA